MAILASKDFTAAKKLYFSTGVRPDDPLLMMITDAVTSFDTNIAISDNFVLNAKNSIFVTR